MKPVLIATALIALFPLAGCTADQLAGPDALAGQQAVLGLDAATTLDGRWSASDAAGSIELKLSDGPSTGADGFFQGEAIVRSPNARHRLLTVTRGKISGDRMTLTLVNARDERIALATGGIKPDFSTFRLRFEFGPARARVLTFERL